MSKHHTPKLFVNWDTSTSILISKRITLIVKFDPLVGGINNIIFNITWFLLYFVWHYLTLWVDIPVSPSYQTIIFLSRYLHWDTNKSKTYLLLSLIHWLSVPTLLVSILPDFYHIWFWHNILTVIGYYNSSSLPM